MERVAQCSCGSLHATTQSKPLMVGMYHRKAYQWQTGALIGNVAGLRKLRLRLKAR